MKSNKQNKQTQIYRGQTDSCQRGGVRELDEKGEGIKQKKSLINTDNTMMITRGEGGREVEEGKGRINSDGRRLDLW